MGSRNVLGSKRTRTLSAATMLLQAAMAYRRGDARTAALYAIAAPLAYRNVVLGLAAQAVAQLSRGRRLRA